jgi:TonB family protein
LCKRRWTVVAWAVARGIALATALPATAQTAAKPADSAASAAMERTQRAANNPMRIILEAAKIKRKPAEPEFAEPVDAPVARKAPLPLRPAAAPAATPKTPTATPTATATADNPTAADAAASLLAEPPAEPPVVEALPATSVAPAPAPVPVAVPAALPPPVAAELVKPKLVTMVEPTIPINVTDRIGRIGEVMVDLTIRPNGTVSEVTVLPPTHRLVQRYVVAALQQWRFEPLPAERLHRVQLIFKP